MNLAKPETDLQRIITSATRLGVELNEADALQWLTAISVVNAEGEDVVVDVKSGVFGHKVSMLDFSSEDLAHFRHIGKIVEFADEPGVETALALSGSAAQSKIQSYPGDADYFERVNIKAESRNEAAKKLGEIMRAKALGSLKGPDFELIEVKLGSYEQAVRREGKKLKAGSPISWSAKEIQAGEISLNTVAGEPLTITWEEAALDPGWCKLDWVVGDPVRKQLVNASNMLDATWESPSGEIVPLDGYLDPYFQEVYLDAASIPVFTKLAKQVDSDALEEYIDQLENEVRKYVHKQPNYGKAAKRMYNIFRLSGRYEEAAYLRELFDEPATVLYQVWALIRTIDDCFSEGSSISLEHMLGMCDNLIVNVTRALEGAVEEEMVRELLQFRDVLARETDTAALSPKAEAARAEVINLVNNFYYEKLTGLPGINAYMDGLKS